MAGADTAPRRCAVAAALGLALLQGDRDFVEAIDPESCRAAKGTSMRIRIPRVQGHGAGVGNEMPPGRKPSLLARNSVPFCYIWHGS